MCSAFCPPIHKICSVKENVRYCYLLKFIDFHECMRVKKTIVSSKKLIIHDFLEVCHWKLSCYGENSKDDSALATEVASIDKSVLPLPLLIFEFIAGVDGERGG